MKRVTLAVLATIVLTKLVSGAETGKHLFILSGQSNMAGLNQNVSFTPAVEKAFGKENVIVVKNAQGGQPIRQWYKKWTPAKGTRIKQPKATGALYDRLMRAVKQAIEGEEIKTVTFVWMQGERDAKERQGPVYAASLRGLIGQLNDDLGRKDINFVIGRLSDAGIKNPDWIKVREVQVQVAEAYERGAWVNTDDINGPKNGVHYTKDGYRILGERFAAKAIELIRRGERKVIR